ncbi:MAG: hypothetical protein WA373_03915 [Burkholderiales bacterium]
MAPDHAPEAEQEVASVEDQVSIEDPPFVTDAGFAASDTVGTGGRGVELTEPAGANTGAPSPPQAANARTSKGTSRNVFIRNIGIPIL